MKGLTGSVSNIRSEESCAEEHEKQSWKKTEHEPENEPGPKGVNTLAFRALKEFIDGSNSKGFIAIASRYMTGPIDSAHVGDTRKNRVGSDRCIDGAIRHADNRYDYTYDSRSK